MCDILKNGYKLPFLYTLSNAEFKNNSSALKNSEFVEESIIIVINIIIITIIIIIIIIIIITTIIIIIYWLVPPVYLIGKTIKSFCSSKTGCKAILVCRYWTSTSFWLLMGQNLLQSKSL